MGDDEAHDAESDSGSERSTGEASDVVGRFYAWWRGDPLPSLAANADLAMAPSMNASFVTDMTGMDIDEVRERVERGHQPWLARAGGEPAGWGWIATREAGISELEIAITLPPGERYLWDFVTAPSWRGRGVYTALLQAMLTQEEAARYWIGHDEGNVPSARGIVKAGFGEVGVVGRMENGRLAFAPNGPADRAGAAAALLGLPMSHP